MPKNSIKGIFLSNLLSTKDIQTRNLPARIVFLSIIGLNPFRMVGLE